MSFDENLLMMNQIQSVVEVPQVVTVPQESTKELSNWPYVDSSNLTSFLKLKKSSLPLIRSFSLNEDSVVKDGHEEPRKRSVPTIYERGVDNKKFSMSSSTTSRKLSLISEQGDSYVVDLGNAIRSGSEDFVRHVIENNGCEILSQLEIQFDTYFRRSPEVVCKVVSKQRLNNDLKARDSLKLNRKRLKLKDRMYVTPFHLAIMAQQTEILLILLRSISTEQMMKRILSTCTKVKWKHTLFKSYILN